MRFICSLFLTLLTTLVNATDGFPPSCKSLAVLEDAVLLTAKKPMLILIHNLGQNDLWLTYPASDVSKEEGLSTHLAAGAWSALVFDKKSMALFCIESKPGHEQQVPCVGQIALCQWTSATLPKSAKGTFWVDENTSLTLVKTHLGGLGYELPV